MASIQVRALGADGNPLRGNGRANFLQDIDAVAQIIATTIKLLQGEWWLDIGDGTPIFQSIFSPGAGVRKQQAAALILQQRILGVPFVTEVSNVQIAMNRATRLFAFSCNALTPFGTLSIQLPGSSATIIE